MKESSEKATGKHKKGNHKGSSSNDYHIPKKVRVKKSCMLCQKHWGTHMPHNTGECRKYEKDGTLKKGFSRKAAIRQKCNGYNKKENANSFVQFMDRFSKLEKTVKKAQISSQKKNHCHEDSDSSYSNLEQDSGYGSTVRFRSNKKSKLDTCVTPSSPIKTTVTSRITNSDLSRKKNKNSNVTNSRITGKNPNRSKITDSKITKIEP